MHEIIFITLGAILGANVRFQINTCLVKKLNLRHHISILVINIFASFGLGLFLSLFDKFRFFIYYYQIILFFSVGFLGSLSTFSSFVYNLFEFFWKLKFLRALKLFMISTSLGIVAFSLGYFLGDL